MDAVLPEALVGRGSQNVHHGPSIHYRCRPTYTAGKPTTCLGKPSRVSVSLIANNGKQKMLLNLLVVGMVNKIRTSRREVISTKQQHYLQNARKCQCGEGK
jgi:hypothetical protein